MAIKDRHHRLGGVLAFFWSVLLVGCTDTPVIDPDAAAVEWLSAEPMSEAGSIADAVAAIQETEDLVARTTVSIRGRIGIGDQPAFDPSQAAFLLSEIIHDPDADAGHDAANCPFCKRKLEKAPKAHVVLIDEDGEPIDQAADQLLGLSKDEVVHVRGDATFDEAMNMVQVKATAVHKEL